MPFYRFKCDSCGEEKSVKLSVDESKELGLTCDCGTNMKRVFSAPPSASIFETGDKYRQFKCKKDVKKILKERSRKHSLKIIGETVEKHGLNTLKDSKLLRNGNRKRTEWDDK